MARNAFGIAAQAIIDQFIYAKIPPHLKKSINKAYLEFGTDEQIVSHLEMELELNDLEAPDEMEINTVTQQAPQQNPEKSKPTCYHWKKLGHYQGRQIKREKARPQIIRMVPTVPTITMVVLKRTPTPTKKTLTIPTRTIQLIKQTEDLHLSSHPVRPVVI